MPPSARQKPSWKRPNAEAVRKPHTIGFPWIMASRPGQEGDSNRKLSRSRRRSCRESGRWTKECVRQWGLRGRPAPRTQSTSLKTLQKNCRCIRRDIMLNETSRAMLVVPSTHAAQRSVLGGFCAPSRCQAPQEIQVDIVVILFTTKDDLTARER